MTTTIFDGDGAHLVFVEVGGGAEGQLVGAGVNATAQLTSTRYSHGLYRRISMLIAGPINTP